MKIGKIPETVMLSLEEYALSETFGWTPNEIKQQDPLKIMEYKAIMLGKSRAEALITKQDKKGLRMI